MVFLETVRTPGLAHLSYVVGSGVEAAVVDPRIDIESYLAIARRHGVRIALVFETHRNEDLVSGARALASVTGARVLHGKALDFGYGEGVDHEHQEQLGNLRLQVLHTPGHTDESISVAVFDDDYSSGAIGVFTGDALFVGDVGRTDFYPDRAEEVAGRLYDSLFDTLLPIGDQASIYPAHGAGSVCGDEMADRDFSSIGHERRNNPRLQLSRSEFIAAKVDEEHVKPPYFQRMEELNLAGAADSGRSPLLSALSADEFAAAAEAGARVVDVRSFSAFAGCAVPASLALPVDIVSGYGGWLLGYDRPLALVGEDAAQVDEAVLQLRRMGFDRFAGHLAGGMPSWATSGRPLQSIPAVSAEMLRSRHDRDPNLTVLDVRKTSEWRAGHVPDARFCFLGDLPNWDGLDGLSQPIVTFCTSGRRALVAASILKQRGVEQVECCFGSRKACDAIGWEMTSEGA